MPKQENWTKVITPKRNFWSLNLAEVIQYRDLLVLFVRRDFVSLYKQTILGPLWLVLQPLFSSFVFSIIFGLIARMSPASVPPVLFYLSGLVAWTYFSDCLIKISNTFTGNAAIFGKVYFPRLIMPLSAIFSNLMKFVVQFTVFLLLWSYYRYGQGANVGMNIPYLILPLVLVWMAGFGLGLGLIISALTTKYRDFRFLIQFGVQLMMYLSSVVIAYSDIPNVYGIRDILWYNPLLHVVEAFKYGFIGQGSFTIDGVVYTSVFMVVSLITGILVFNRVEKNFMDTV